MNQIKHTYLLLPLALGAPLLQGEVHAQRVESPNIIFILSDDQGWANLSYPMDRNLQESQSDYHQTPNMERMARMGMRFSNGYASAAVSSPSRRSIQYGETPIRQGSVAFGKTHERGTDRITIPAVLKSINPLYRTAHYGKWDFRADLFPEDLGYDESDGCTGNAQGNLSRTADDGFPAYELTTDPKRMNSLTDRSVNFMKRQVAAKHPFYLQISHYAMHEGYQSTEATYRKYAKMKRGMKHYDPGWAAMQDDFDQTVGVLLDQIERLGISHNTYVIFLSDNGAQEAIPQILPPPEKMAHPSVHGRQLRNYPLRGGKWVLYEGGIRVPFLIMGPGIAGGTQCDVPVVGWDLLPTIADLAGYTRSMPANIDGGSLKTVLENEGKGEVKRLHESFFFHRYHATYPHSAVRKGDYKLIRQVKTGKVELYNLKTDIGEVHDISAEHPEVCRLLIRELDQYMESVHAEALRGFQGKPASAHIRD